MTNIAEILENAPKCLKLYSPLIGEVEFTSVYERDGRRIVEASRHDKQLTLRLDKFGRFLGAEAECILLPSKDHRTWDNWQEVLIPQCVGSVIASIDCTCTYEWIVTKNGMFVMNMNADNTYLHPFNEMYYDDLVFATLKEAEVFFERLNKLGYKFENGEVVKKEKEWSILDAKDGDFVCDMYNETIFIFKEINSQKALMEYVSYPTPLDFLVQMKSNGNQHSTLGNYYDEKKYRLATTEEVQLLLCKLNDAGYYWDENNKEVKKIEKKFTINDFKPFDKVLVRQCDERNWQVNLFSHIVPGCENKKVYFCLEYAWMQCVPYNEETAHLLGTSEEYNGPYKTWED